VLLHTENVTHTEYTRHALWTNWLLYPQLEKSSCVWNSVQAVEMWWCLLRTCFLVFSIWELKWSDF